MQFAAGLSRLLQQPQTLLLEVGPGRALGVLVNQHQDKQREQLVLASLRNHFQQESDQRFLLHSLGKLWLAGVPIDWAAVVGDRPWRRVPLPSYPFAKTRYWIDPPAMAPARAAASGGEGRFGPLISSLEPLEQATQAELQIRLFADFPGPPGPPSLVEQLNRLCARYVLDYLTPALQAPDRADDEVEDGSQEDGSQADKSQHGHALSEVQQRLRLQPEFAKFFRWMLHVLGEEGWIELQDERLRLCVDADSLPTAQQMEAAIVQSAPELEASLAYLRNCVAHYPQALAGEIEAISVLYPEGRGADMQRPDEDDSYKYTNQRLYVEVLARAIGQFIEDKDGEPPLRLLEVGGGNGFLTQAVMGRVQGRVQGKVLVDYQFTDIGPSLLRYMQAYAEQQGLAGQMGFARLDISRDPLQQGFAAEGFDLILALDVVHATPHIAQTLAHLRTLLRPGGLLCLIEPVKQQRWIDLVGGLAEGWWLFADSDLRPLSPLLDQQQWQQLLNHGGFAPVLAFPRSQAEQERTDAALFIAQRPEAEPGQPENPHENPHLDQPCRPLAPALHIRPQLMNAAVAPRNDIEQQVAAIWQAVLGIEGIGVYDEFADLGGDSLIAIRITARLRDQFAVQVPVKTLMAQPTIAALSQAISSHLASQGAQQQAGQGGEGEGFVQGRL
ncbi:MAG: phosphopantetheine-binding protein [Gammaproteobacteria bacterium SHHR-1]